MVRTMALENSEELGNEQGIGKARKLGSATAPLGMIWLY